MFLEEARIPSEGVLSCNVEQGLKVLFTQFLHYDDLQSVRIWWFIKIHNGPHFQVFQQGKLRYDEIK